MLFQKLEINKLYNVEPEKDLKKDLVATKCITKGSNGKQRQKTAEGKTGNGNC